MRCSIYQNKAAPGVGPLFLCSVYTHSCADIIKTHFLNSTQMPTTLTYLFSTDLSPELSLTCPVAYLTFPLRWVKIPKLSYWTLPIPMQNAVFANFLISVNRDIFLLTQAKRVILHSSSHVPHPPISCWDHIDPTCEIHPEFNHFHYLHFYQSEHQHLPIRTWMAAIIS